MATIQIGKKVVKTDRAGAPLGPYSQGIIANGFVFVAGEKGVDPKTGKIVSGGIEPETRQTLDNIQAILEAAGSSFDMAVSAVVHMTNLDDFVKMNKVFAEYFKLDPPGRTTVEVNRLPTGAQVEITVTALVKI